MRLLTEQLQAKVLGRTQHTPGYMTLPDVACDLYWTGGQLLIGGPASRAAPSTFIGNEVVILCLDPVLVHAWLGVPLSDLRDQIFTLDSINKTLAAQVSDLHDSGRLSDLVKRNAPRPELKTRASHMAMAADALRGGARVAQVAAKLDLSSRHFERMFKEHTGLPPKLYARILRFRRAIHAAKRGASLAEAAYLSGYADQAHFAREARQLSDMTVRQLLPDVANVQDTYAGSWD